MKKISIIRNNVITSQAQFSNDELLNEWLNREIANKSFGEPERKVVTKQEERIEHPEIPEEKDGEGNIIQAKVDAWTEIIPEEFYIIPAEFTYTIEDITAELEKQERINQKLRIGAITDKACNDAFMYIQGANVERNLTSEQKLEMITLFAPALQAIQVKRPGQLKAYINSINPDGVLITAEMKEDLLEILKVF